jgi:hypothetical protein
LKILNLNGIFSAEKFRIFGNSLKIAKNNLSLILLKKSIKILKYPQLYFLISIKAVAVKSHDFINRKAALHINRKLFTAVNHMEM